jgi:hypothetical protein
VIQRYYIRHADGGLYVNAYTAADAKIQGEVALGWTPRPYNNGTPDAGPIAYIEPAPLGEWRCSCGVTWSAPASPICHSCGKISP